ncbi:uncharacterized protein ube2ql1 isoform X1 [Coregonus clupeaformis]|uniref:uncharacterized protein ube2ql1 isoform X1 n=1 Tax=Coregonus clupeaformis TaxID=59861 RepID=UPI001E1C4853|nr:uncharacterized protein ube2ql1 isoform X1 [Coregonus clupeaformis]
MATLLRKIGLIRLHDRDTEDPKHHQGSLKGTKGNTKNNTKQHCQTTNETNNILSTPEIKAKKLDQHSSKDKPSVKDKQQGKDTNEKQQMGSGGGGGIGVGKSATSASIPPLAPQRQHCTQVRTRRLMKELQEIRRLGDNFITVELVDDNLFDWNVKLHQVDKDSALWQDMKETNTEFILLNVSFPDNFPFSPPFMRVLTPRLENGYVLDGGAICMELLTPRGWSSAYTVEAVMRQFAASLVKGQLFSLETRIGPGLPHLGLIDLTSNLLGYNGAPNSFLDCCWRSKTCAKLLLLPSHPATDDLAARGGPESTTLSYHAARGDGQPLNM